MTVRVRVHDARHDDAVTPTEPEEHGRGRDRALAFSDGVFAIAITLLVLNLRAPHLSGHDLDRQLRHALGREGGVLVGFVLSFYVIARYWLLHHRMSLRLRRVDARFMVMNLVFLAFIVFLPFPAEILGLYGQTVTAVVLYASTMVVIGVTSLALWEYAIRARLMAPVGDEERHEFRRRAIIPIVVFGSSLPLAFASTTVAKLWWTLLVAAPLLRSTIRRHRARRSSSTAARAGSRGGPDEPPRGGAGSTR